MLWNYISNIKIDSLGEVFLRYDGVFVDDI